MVETVSVSMSGLTLSFLLYENLKDQFTQEGFLIGQIFQKETKAITDNDQVQVRIARIIQINGSLPCYDHLYDGAGKLDVESIKEYLGPLFPKVVAWYKYKGSSSSFKFTFREKIIHQQLSELFEVPPELFTCCHLISEVSDNKSTHSYTQTFIRHCNNKYEEIPLHIINLSDPNNSYKTSEEESETFRKIVEDLKIDLKNAQGIDVITKIQNAVQKRTDELVEILAEREALLFERENEVRALKKQQRAKDEMCSLEEEENGEKASASNHSENKVLLDAESEAATKSRNSLDYSKGAIKKTRSSMGPAKRASLPGQEVTKQKNKV